MTTSYVYDASGKLLIQDDNGVPTLYLPDEEVTCTTVSTGGSCTAETAVRYYSIGGVTIAARTSAGQVEYLAGDQQGTATMAIDSATLAVTRRWFDPNGNQLNQSTSWPGNRGFVNGTADPTTELDNLGAREFNPGTSSFISPDAILNPYDPDDLNPYGYASDNPATFSDPSGLCAGLPGERLNCNGQPVSPPTTNSGSGGGSYNPYDPYGPYGPIDGGPGAIGGSSCALDGSCQPVISTVTLRTIIADKAAPITYCAPNALHTGEDLGSCVFGARPSRRSDFNTFGICGIGTAGFVVGGTASFCILISHNPQTGQYQLGSAETTGGGPVLPVLGFGFGPTLSNASTISDMGGPFSDVGGSGEVLGVSAGADMYAVKGPHTRLIDGGDFTVGPKIEGPAAAVGFETHVFVTDTWTQTWVSW